MPGCIVCIILLFLFVYIFAHKPLELLVFDLNIMSLELVSRYRDTQLQVNENLGDL